MKKAFLLLLCINALFFRGFTQDEILLKIGDKEITKSEFKRIYEKNNSADVSIDVKSVDEYLELFINFKLKVVEAENLGMDTLKDFTDELSLYEEELAKPYLIDNDLYEKQIAEAYERMKTEVRLSYLYFEIATKATPADTLVIYNNVFKTYKKLEKGESFEKVAADTTLGIKSSGDTWFLTALKAPYQIENFMYENEIGDFSKPLREKNGYYIVKITEKRDNPGEVKVAHIMVTVPQGSSEETENAAKEKIDMIKTKLNEGSDFAELAKEYSDDKSSGTNGGELQMFGTGVMIQPFEEAAFNLKNIGEISEPVRTFYGWHIIKKLDSKPLASFEEKYDDIKLKVFNDKRYELCKTSVIENLKKEYNFTEVNKLANIYKVVDSTVFKSSWDISKAKGLNAVLFTFADQKFTEQDFAKYISENQKWQADKDVLNFVDNSYTEFVNSSIKDYEKTNLSNKYEDYKYIMQEYHDGILLFSLQEKMVWNKAVEDSTGLKEFYEQNKYNYMAGEKIDASLFSYSNDTYLKQAQKVLKKKTKKGLSDSLVVSMIDTTGKNFSLIENDKFEKGDNEITDKIFEMKGKGEISETQNIVTLSETKNIVFINSFIEPQPKELKEIKGLVIADYQTKLEEAWIKELRAKYTVTVNENVLKTIK